MKKSENKAATFSVVSTEWLNMRRPQLKESSLAKYTNILTLHLLPEYGTVQISSIDRQDLIRYSGMLLTNGRGGEKGLSPKTVNGILSVMKNVFEYARTEKGVGYLQYKGCFSEAISKTHADLQQNRAENTE